MYQNVKNVLISKEKLAARVAEIGKQITEDYEGKNPILVCTLRGACVFFADLLREVKTHCEIDFIATSSYASGTRSSGVVKLVKDLNTNIEGRDVIIVEDIIDTGLTLSYLKQLLLTREPNSVKICSLLDKPSRREVDLEGDYVGFSIPNEFVIGYGLDYDEKYRNLPEVCIMDTSKL